MTETEQLADIIALSVHAATEPLLTKIAVLEVRPVGFGTKEAWDALQETLTDLRSRLMSVEARAPIPGPPGPQGERGEVGLKGRDGLNGERGVDGLNGKDADLAIIAELRAELASMRAEVLSVKAWPMPRDGKDGTSVTVADVAPLVEAEVTKAVALIPAPRNGLDGKSVSIDDMRPVIAAEVSQAVTAIPKPKDGKSLTPEDVLPLIQAEVAKIPPAPRGADGKSVDLADVEALVSAKVDKAIAAIPRPKDGENGKDGQSVTLDDVTPLITASVAKAFEAMPKPKDGLGIKTAVVNNDGRFLMTLSDDAVMDLGPVVGKAGRDGMPAIGRPGADGTSVTVDDVRPMIHAEITKAVAAIPKPTNGTNGTNGKDGLGFDDLAVTFDEHKGVQLVFEKGAQRKTFDLQVPFYTGVWTAGRLYPKGATVTVRGAMYIALEPTRTRPEDGSPESAKAWRLCVKGGRDGKNGTNGRDGKDWNA